MRELFVTGLTLSWLPFYGVFLATPEQIQSQNLSREMRDQGLPALRQFKLWQAITPNDQILSERILVWTRYSDRAERYTEATMVTNLTSALFGDLDRLVQEQESLIGYQVYQFVLGRHLSLPLSHTDLDNSARILQGERVESEITDEQLYEEMIRFEEAAKDAVELSKVSPDQKVRFDGLFGDPE